MICSSARRRRQKLFSSRSSSPLAGHAHRHPQEHYCSQPFCGGFRRVLHQHVPCSLLFRHVRLLCSIVGWGTRCHNLREARPSIICRDPRFALSWIVRKITLLQVWGAAHCIFPLQSVWPNGSHRIHHEADAWRVREALPFDGVAGQAAAQRPAATPEV